MTKVTFLHTSDWQIGITRWFLSGEAQARFDDARKAAITRLGEVARSKNCDFILVAGDVFESNSLSSQTTGRTREALKDLGLPVYLLPGNHDPLTPDSIFYSSAADADNVHVIASSEPIEVAPGVELVGAPLKAKRAYEDLVRLALEPLSPCAPATVRIAVGHGQALARTSEPAPDTIDLDFVEECLENGVINYLALGDTHSAQPIGTSGAVWFSGAPEVTAYHDLDTAGGEANSGNVLVVTVSDSEPLVVEEIPVGTWKFETFKRAINSRAEAEAFIAELEAYPNKDRVAVKYALEGSVDLGTMRYLERELDRLKEIFAALYPRERTMDLQLDPEESDLAEMNLSGYQNEALQELIHATKSDGAEQETARDALRLLFRLSGETK
ncbi:exonuclease SbcCD subunit D [Staphylococcus chromogenes]|nr:exonuclease SbcCD subunit D [Staphylococcus chromogenes]